MSSDFLSSDFAFGALDKNGRLRRKKASKSNVTDPGIEKYCHWDSILLTASSYLYTKGPIKSRA